MPNYRITQVCPNLGSEELKFVTDSITSSWITEGPRSQEFVAELNELVGVPYGVLAPNGTLALALGLMAIGVGPGDEVLVPDVTFMGSATAVIMVGATPVCVDVERETFQFDVSKAKERLTPRTRAVMPVHLFGTACDMNEIQSFAKKHDLLVIEDAAQGIAVRFNGQHVGSFGDVAAFSFFADKTITTGEGGYVSCRSEEVYERLRLLRNQGRLDRGSFVHPSIGYNYRITDLQSGIGLAQLRKLPNITSRKTELIALYRQHLEGVEEVRILGAASGANHVPFRCVLMADRVRQLCEHLEENGVQTRSFFHPLHRQPALRDWAAASCDREKSPLNDFSQGAPEPLPAHYFDDEEYANAVYGWDHGVCLPMHTMLTNDDVQFICEKIKTFYQCHHEPRLLSANL